MSIVAPGSALSIMSVHPLDDKCQEILDEFPSANDGEKYPTEIIGISH